MTNPPSIRSKIEAILRPATKPMSPQAISKATGATLAQVRSALSVLVTQGRTENIGTNNAPLYVLNKPIERESVSRFSEDPYTGEVPTQRRPGAMDAFTLPSLQGDRRIDRVRPAIISARTLEAVGGRGK